LYSSEYEIDLSYILILYTLTPLLDPPIFIVPDVLKDLPLATAPLSRIPLFTMYASPSSLVLLDYTSDSLFIINASLIFSFDL